MWFLLAKTHRTLLCLIYFWYFHFSAQKYICYSWIHCKRYEFTYIFTRQNLGWWLTFPIMTSSVHWPWCDASKRSNIDVVQYPHVSMSIHARGVRLRSDLFVYYHLLLVQPFIYTCVDAYVCIYVITFNRFHVYTDVYIVYYDLRSLNLLTCHKMFNCLDFNDLQQ